MPFQDDALLARLNALRQSHLTLDNAPSLALDSTNSEELSARHASQDTDLTARFRKLAPNKTVASGLDEQVTPRNEEDDQTLEDLLTELGPEDQWALNPDDPEHINSLLEEARQAVSAEEARNDQAGQESDTREGKKGEMRNSNDQTARPKEDGDEDGNEAQRSQNEDQQDEEEADAYIARLLAEIDVEEKFGEDDGATELVDAARVAAEETDTDTRTEDGGSGLDLPSAPTELPSSPPATVVETSDDALSARFASLGLPSAPSFSPSKKPIKVTKGKAGSSLPKYTDDDIDSWCCICNEDATVRCLGCDGDLYCQTCWKEGHGNGPGQEKGHRAVQYSRDKGMAV